MAHVLLAAYPNATRLLIKIQDQEKRQKLAKFIASQQPTAKVVATNAP